jgi:hypothetical protein
MPCRNVLHVFPDGDHAWVACSAVENVRQSLILRPRASDVERPALLRDSVKIRREIARLYDKDPQGWNVLVGKDPAGFFDALISHGRETWQVKEYQVNPYKFVGLGSRIPNLPSNPLDSNEHQFGLRPIGLDSIKELSSVIDEPKALSELASKLLGEKPVSSSEAMESPAILQGPIVQSNKPLDSLSTAQGKLDEKLRRELRRIIRKDFRHTLTPYI